jgi:hypothetical protein
LRVAADFARFAAAAICLGGRGRTSTRLIKVSKILATGIKYVS